jgi:hypothetical protein
LHPRIGQHLTLFHARVLPEIPSKFDGVDTSGSPPGSLVAGAMRGAVMRTAKADCEFVAVLRPGAFAVSNATNNTAMGLFFAVHTIWDWLAARAEWPASEPIKTPLPRTGADHTSY